MPSSALKRQQKGCSALTRQIKYEEANEKKTWKRDIIAVDNKRAAGQEQ